MAATSSSQCRAMAVLYGCILLATVLRSSQAFQPVTTKSSVQTQGYRAPIIGQPRSSFALSATRDGGGVRGRNGNGNRKRGSSKGSGKAFTIADLREEVMRNPAKYVDGRPAGQKKKKRKKTSRRTRKRVEQPQQQYLYKAQRDQLVEEGKLSPDSKDGDGTSDAAQQLNELKKLKEENDPTIQARKLGILAANQHCDPAIDENRQPRILGQVRASDGAGSAAFAYLIEKPAGWAIVGSNSPSKSKAKATDDSDAMGTKKKSKPGRKRKVTIVEDGGGMDSLEFDESEVLTMMTPEEVAEWKAKGDELFENAGPVVDETAGEDASSFNDFLLDGFDQVSQMTAEERKEAGIEAEDFDPDDVVEFNEADILAALTPEEREEIGLEAASASAGEGGSTSTSDKEQRGNANAGGRTGITETTAANFKRIQARKASTTNRASFALSPRPSIVAWLKETKAEEGIPIKGGKFWTALAGATTVDDSGIVLLAPKSCTDNLFVDYTEYIAVIGNGNNLAKPQKQAPAAAHKVAKEMVELESLGRVRKGRTEDVVQSVQITVAETPSSCSSIVSHMQDQFDDGVRGDPEANPLDRRAPRRLIHCHSMSVSSLVADEDIQLKLDFLPDDISIFADRRDGHEFNEGSFLGRDSLRLNPSTTAYREINGAADGFPGWTVDRYSDWLLVQHDEREYRGPLPSIHDGYTAGVYYLPASPDRSSMGSAQGIRPRLLEGKPAPDVVEIAENGVKYLVTMDKDLSTGIFLDQRLHRGWLTKNCNSDTRVLNCFAHCGAFSIAAATAGASTVSMDLNKKWLDRIQPQLELNGIEFDERHDCIYGDCFEWLEKLSKRGEKFDIVIVDPPSSSVGKKKRRWSVKNDMAELAALAGPLVKKGGLLWTTTNSAGLNPLKYAKDCRKGLESVGLHSARLERVQPMPEDFPTIGPQPVKNLVWRIK